MAVGTTVASGSNGDNLLVGIDLYYSLGLEQKDQQPPKTYTVEVCWSGDHDAVDINEDGAQDGNCVRWTNRAIEAGAETALSLTIVGGAGEDLTTQQSVSD